MKKLIHKIEISDEAFQLLLDIQKFGQAEYRDTEFSSLADFFENRDIANTIQTEKWFLDRNFNGTYYLIYELIEHELVELVPLSWHITYRINDVLPQSKELWVSRLRVVR